MSGDEQGEPKYGPIPMCSEGLDALESWASQIDETPKILGGELVWLARRARRAAELEAFAEDVAFAAGGADAEGALIGVRRALRSLEAGGDS